MVTDEMQFDADGHSACGDSKSRRSASVVEDCCLNARGRVL